MSTRPNIILVGFMGTGKSAVGRQVAKRLRFQFIDTDAVITNRSGTEINELFEVHGEEHFRDLETGAIESLGGFNRCVISTGGGAVLREENRRLMRELGFVVLLEAHPDTILDRVSRTSKRPLLNTNDPRSTIAALLAEREPAYRAAADFVVDTTTISIDDAAEIIVTEARKAFAW
jgi:shikimate kinase